MTCTYETMDQVSCISSKKKIKIFEKMVDRSTNTLNQIKATAPCFDRSSSVHAILPKMKKKILLLSVCLAVITVGVAIPSHHERRKFGVAQGKRP